MFFEMLKKLYWDLSWRQGRYEFWHWLCRDIPGHFGNVVRRCVLKRFFGNAGENLLIYPGIHIRGIQNLRVGNNVFLGLNLIMNANGGIDIGDDVLIGPNVKIWSVNHNYMEISQPIHEQGFVDKPVVIEKGCWLGTSTIVLPGATIGENTIVSAGSVIISKKYPSNIILAGNPARKVFSRGNEEK